MSYLMHNDCEYVFVEDKSGKKIAIAYILKYQRGDWESKQYWFCCNSLDWVDERWAPMEGDKTLRKSLKNLEIKQIFSLLKDIKKDEELCKENLILDAEIRKYLRKQDINLNNIVKCTMGIGIYDAERSGCLDFLLEWSNIKVGCNIDRAAEEYGIAPESIKIYIDYLSREVEVNGVKRIIYDFETGKEEVKTELKEGDVEMEYRYDIEKCSDILFPVKVLNEEFTNKQSSTNITNSGSESIKPNKCKVKVVFPDNRSYTYNCAFEVSIGDKVQVGGKRSDQMGEVVSIEGGWDNSPYMQCVEKIFS